jgi:hypothetical protein
VGYLQWKVSDAWHSVAPWQSGKDKDVEWRRQAAARKQPAAGMKTNAHQPNRKWLGAKCFVQFKDLVAVAGFGFHNAISTICLMVHCFDMGKVQSLFFFNFSYKISEIDCKYVHLHKSHQKQNKTNKMQCQNETYNIF